MSEHRAVRDRGGSGISRAVLVILICLGVARSGIAADAADPARFDTWRSAWQADGSQRSADAQKIVADGSFLMYYDSVEANVSALLGHQPTTDERAWIENFRCALRADRVDPPALQAVDKVLHDTPEGSRPPAQSVATFRRLYKGDIFRASTPINDANYRLFEGAQPVGVFASCPGFREIKIAPDSTSSVARQLFDAADRLTRLFALQNDPAMAATAKLIADAQQRWERFFKNVLLDEFPWEIAANDALGGHWSPLRGTLATPPGAQIRLVHPVPVIVGHTQGGSGATPRVAAEVLGWRRYDADTFAPKWGISSLFVLKGSSSESNGYGVLLAAKNVSLGVVVQDSEHKRNGVSIVLGVDFAKVFDNDVASLRDRKAALEASWKSLFEATGH